jgi:hypothetical protein
MRQLESCRKFPHMNIAVRHCLPRVGNDEVTFEDTDGLGAPSKKGFWGFGLCCNQSSKDNLETARVDACCI